MALNLVSLDPGVREAMVAEFKRDRAAGAIFLSPRLTAARRQDYPGLLRDALASSDDGSLAHALGQVKRLETHETQTKDKGGSVTKHLPANAASLIAEGDFNRFYIRGLCVRAIAAGVAEVEVYRAKEVSEPRPESEALIGRRFAPADLLDDLRAYTGDQQPALGVPGGPNSGISVRLPAH